MPTPAPLDEEDRASLVAYLDGELDEATTRAVETRLNLDPTFRAELEALRQTWELLDYLPQAEPSPTFTSRTLDRVSVLRLAPSAARPVTRRLWTFAAGWAAAVTLALVGGYFLGSALSRQGPTPMGPADLDRQLARDLRLIENKRLYEAVDNIDFLRALDDPDLFGDDS